MLPTRSNNAMADMAKVMSIVRDYSDARLADVLAGKDMSVPQFAAMTEAMGRKQLRQAVDGQQAMQQAQQPSVKDQLLAEQQAEQAQMGGIAALPAPNMEAMGEGMAGGGIIAFSGKDGSYVDELEYLKATDPEAYARQKRQSEAWKRVADSGKPYSVEEFRGDVVDPIKNFFTAPWDKAKAEDAKKAEIARLMKEKNIGVEEAAALQSVKNIQTQDSPLDYDMYDPAAPAAPAAANPNAPAAGAPNPAINIAAPTTFERRASPFGQLSAEPVDVEGLKSRGLGEGLMRLSAGLLSAPGAKGLSAGVAALAEQAGLTRKETNALKKDARDYDLNLRKAEDAFERGQEELGLKYTEAANLNKYRMDSLAKEPDALRVAREALKDPKLAAILSKADKGEMLTVKDATTAFNDIVEKNPKYARELAGLGIKDPMAYRQFVITGLPPMQVVGTLTEGAKVRN